MRHDFKENVKEVDDTTHENEEQKDIEIQKTLHQNDLLLFHLEESKRNEERLRKEIDGL